MPFKFQLASDVIRDGIGCELLSEDGEIIAEVFRSDRDHGVVVSMFKDNVPLDAMEALFAQARSRLNPFECGDALDTAKNFSALR